MVIAIEAADTRPMSVATFVEISKGEPLLFKGDGFVHPGGATVDFDPL
jgi:hypothetical protein